MAIEGIPSRITDDKVEVDRWQCYCQFVSINDRFNIVRCCRKENGKENLRYTGQTIWGQITSQ